MANQNYKLIFLLPVYFNDYYILPTILQQIKGNCTECIFPRSVSPACPPDSCARDERFPDMYIFFCRPLAQIDVCAEITYLHIDSFFFVHIQETEAYAERGHSWCHTRALTFFLFITLLYCPLNTQCTVHRVTCDGLVSQMKPCSDCRPCSSLWWTFSGRHIKKKKRNI